MKTLSDRQVEAAVVGGDTGIVVNDELVKIVLTDAMRRGEDCLERGPVKFDRFLTLCV